MSYEENKMQDQYENCERYLEELHPVMQAIDEIMVASGFNIDDILYAAKFMKETSPSKDIISESDKIKTDPDYIPW